MLGIGINEYVHLASETKLNEKGQLELHLKAQMSDDEVLKQVMEGKEVRQGTVRLTLFPGFKVDFETKARKTSGQLVKEMQDYQKTLTEFLKIYLTTEQIEEHFSLKIMLGAAPNEAAFASGLKTDDFVDKVYTYISQKFIEVVQKFNLFEHRETFRIKLWRQSETKPYPKIPTGFGKWIESMRIPWTDASGKITSDLQMTDYEKKNKKLNADAPAPDATPAEEENKATLFTGRAEEEDDLPFKP